MEDLLKKDVTHFDLNKPHMRVTGEKGVVTIVQNGFIYAYSIPNPKVPNIGGKIIGKVGDMKLGATKNGHKFCDFCGFTFGLAEGLERHLYEVHRDVLLMSIIQNHKEELEPGVLPTEDQLKGEATRIVTGDEAQEALAKDAEKKNTPEVKAFEENKAKKKGAYREPIRR